MLSTAPPKRKWCLSDKDSQDGSVAGEIKLNVSDPPLGRNCASRAPLLNKPAGRPASSSLLMNDLEEQKAITVYIW